METIKPIEFDPYKNPNAISIIRQEDGNYKAYKSIAGLQAEVRAGDPNTVLNMILTHE